jgi:dUTP pyrophosphatase
MNVKFKKLHKDAQVPQYKTSGAIACDFATIEEVTIKPGEHALIKTGIAIEFPKNYGMIIAPRSSICLKNHLDAPHSIGVIDNDYRGEILIPLRNIGTEAVTLVKGERIAQGIFIPYTQVQFEEAEELSETERGGGRLGSTGVI